MEEPKRRQCPLEQYRAIPVRLPRIRQVGETWARRLRFRRALHDAVETPAPDIRDELPVHLD